MSRASFLADQVNEVLSKVTGGLLMLMWDGEQEDRLTEVEALRYSGDTPADDVQGGVATVVQRVGEGNGYFEVIPMGDVGLVPGLLDNLRGAMECGAVGRSPMFGGNNVWAVLAILEKFWTDRHPQEVLDDYRREYGDTGDNS